MPDQSILKALIIDDEPLAHKVIVEYAKDVSFLEIVAQCYLATEALSILNKQDIDVIFLDINMPKLKGLDFLRTLNKKPIVIIISAYQEYALESFELDVIDYLLKPFRFERFLKAVNKAMELHHMKHASIPSPSTPAIPNNKNTNQLFIKSDKKYIQLELSEIYYLESYGNYVKVWLGDNFHLTPRTLSSFEGELPDSDFYKIHKSFIINRKYINFMEGNILMMKNNKSLPIGKNHRGDFKRFIAPS